MLRLIVQGCLMGWFWGTVSLCFAEKVYVVERGRGNISVIEHGKRVRSIGKLGRLHHATIKFWRGFAFIISRDGWLSRIDTKTDRVVQQVKVGKSSIGFVVVDERWLVVANYAPKNIVVLDATMRKVKEIDTGSRNVGIKSWRSLLVFSLMDRDQIWVLDAQKQFQVIHKVAAAGRMPFDALIAEHLYVAAFFKQRVVGMLDLKTLRYHQRPLPNSREEVLYKIPHFGLWGIHGAYAYVPVSGARKLAVLHIAKFAVGGQIPLPGLPVFASLSPDGRFLAINYSGEQQNGLTVMERKHRKIVRHWDVGRRVMHMRFSANSQFLYISSYFENQVHVLSIPSWKRVYSVVVPTPSGIFVVP